MFSEGQITRLIIVKPNVYGFFVIFVKKKKGNLKQRLGKIEKKNPQLFKYIYIIYKRRMAIIP